MNPLTLISLLPMAIDVARELGALPKGEPRRRAKKKIHESARTAAREHVEEEKRVARPRR